MQPLIKEGKQKHFLDNMRGIAGCCAGSVEAVFSRQMVHEIPFKPFNKHALENSYNNNYFCRGSSESSRYKQAIRSL